MSDYIICGQVIVGRQRNATTCKGMCQKTQHARLQLAYYHRKRAAHVHPEKPCGICGKPFTPGHGAEKYHIGACQREAQRRRSSRGRSWKTTALRRSLRQWVNG